MRSPIEVSSSASGRRVPKRPKRRRLAPLRQLAEIVAVALLIGAALALLSAGPGQPAMVVFAVMSLISLCFAGAYVGMVRLVLDRLLERVGPGWQAALLHLGAVVLAASLGGEVAVRLVMLIGGRVERLRVFAIGLAVLSAIRVIELGYEQLRRHVREVELREERARQQALRAELAALEARTDPHFLFNSLNTVAGLIEENPPLAVEVVTRLAGYFRHSLRGAREGRVRLGEELASAATYLEIQGLRFADTLRWSIDTEPEVDEIPVPPFLLQPLVENAVVHGHGGRGSRAGTRVRLAARRRGGDLLVTVEDDGPGPGGSSHHGSGSALADLAERLELLYSGAAKVTTGRSSTGGFLVQVELPIEAEVSLIGGDA